MGLDVGSRTVGVAVSDMLGWTAQGVEIVQINEDEQEFGLDRIAELVKENEVVGFVLGLPKNMNNTSGPRVEAAKAYGELLKEKFNLPIDFIDEHLTNVETERMLVEQANASRKKRKKVIDKLAASLILQNYLDAKGKLLKELNRKSTRLNSSHVSISYAVFCLKKKRTGESERRDTRTPITTDHR